MKFLVALVLFLFSATSVSAAGLPTMDQPYPGITGTSKGRVIEVQVWWFPSFGHIHATAVLPVGSTASGNLMVPVRVILHNNPSFFYRVELFMTDGAKRQVPLQSIDDHFPCDYEGVGNHECGKDYEFNIDTKKYADGWKEIYLKVESLSPDEHALNTSSRIPVEFSNGNRHGRDAAPVVDGDCAYTSATGIGSYEGYGAHSDQNKSATATALCMPMKPVSGVLNQQFVGGNSTSHLTIFISKTHYIPPAGKWREQNARDGMVLWDKNGKFSSPFPIRIDTTKLMDGRHTVAIKSTIPETLVSICSYCTNVMNELSGLVVYDMWVDNSRKRRSSDEDEAPTMPPTTSPPGTKDSGPVVRQ